MRSIIDSLLNTFRYLNVVRELPDQFDRHERRLVFQAIVVGIVVWAVVYSLKVAVHEVFHVLVHWLEHAPSPWLLFLPLLIGAIIVATIVRYRAATLHYRDKDGHIHELLDVEGDGLERAISLYFSSKPNFESTLLGREGVEARWMLPTTWLVIRKWLATLVTIGSGGSGGLEASVTLIGEGTASALFKPREVTENINARLGWFGRFYNWWKSSDVDDLQSAQLCGIAAAVSVLLGAPFAAAFFAIEVMYRRRPVIDKLVYALISSLIAFLLSRIVSGGKTALFHVDSIIEPAQDVNYYVVLGIMAVFVSIVSVYFAQLRGSFEDGFHKRQPEIYRRHLTGAFVTGVVAIAVYYVLPLLTDEAAILDHRFSIVLGAGEEAIDLALNGEMVLWVAVLALFTKMVATLATVGSGGSAGLLVPSIYFGAMVAAISAELSNLPAQTLIIPAITASLVAIVNVPLAAILLPVELFGVSYMLPSLVCLVICSIFAHRSSIYRTQRDKYAGREILPGYSTQRVGIPEIWQGKSLIELDLRQRFDVSVIGLIERYDPSGEVKPQVQLNPDPNKPLTFDDTLVVIGTDGQLKEFTAAIQAKRAVYANRSTSSEEAAS